VVLPYLLALTALLYLCKKLVWRDLDHPRRPAAA